MNPSRLSRLAAIGSLAFALGALTSTAQDSPPQYTIKRLPAPGSLDPRIGATSPDLPLNRRYAQLTEGEKAIVRGCGDAPSRRIISPMPVRRVLSRPYGSPESCTAAASGSR